ERTARRYHWLSERVRSFVDDPHAAIEGPNQGTILNLTDHRAAPARDIQLELAKDPDALYAEVRRLRESEPVPQLSMPFHHDVRPSDVLLRRLRATLAAVADLSPAAYEELLLVPGVGARTVFALSLVAEVIHGVPARFADPARFSFALGGKDGHPFPVPLPVYDETIRVRRSAMTRARLGGDERLAAIRRLDAQARLVEKTAGGRNAGRCGQPPSMR